MNNSNSIISRFINQLREHSFILNRDFSEIVNVLPHKREVFVNKGVKIFLAKIMEEMQIFQINIQHYVDTKPTESFLDVVVSMKIYRNQMCEYIVFSPLKGHVFHTDKSQVYFNNRVISRALENKNLMSIDSNNPLFLHNLYPCYLLCGCFKEIFIHKNHIDKNKYGLEIIKKIENINIEELNDQIRIFNF